MCPPVCKIYMHYMCTKGKISKRQHISSREQEQSGISGTGRQVKSEKKRHFTLRRVFYLHLFYTQKGKLQSSYNVAEKIIH